MADEKISFAYGDTINGTDGDDRIESYGERSQIDGGAGDDLILSKGYLSTVHGGDGNDRINIVGSYVQVFGDEGDDLIGVDCSVVNVNIANVSLSGGEGSDVFWFRPSADKRIFASTITDFNAADGDAIFLSNAYDVNTFYLDAVREFDRSITLVDSSGLIRINLQGVHHFDEIADGALVIGVGDSALTASIGDALYPRENVANGLTKRYNVGYLSSNYGGDFRLDVVNNLLGDAAVPINVIDAVDDTVGGRMLAGDANDNQIFAGDYGNKLWGGDGGGDYLIGGNGDDTFFAGATGDDVSLTHIVGCAENDLVVLWNVNPGEFSMGEWTKEDVLDESYLDVTANDGSNIRIHCPDGVSTTTFQLGDGSRWQYNHADRFWQALEPDTSDQLPNPLPSEAEDDTEQPSTPLPSEAEDDTEQPSTPLPSELEVLYGDENDNTLMAGDDGAELWGGPGGNDLLFGGAGADVFRAGKGEGNTEIWGYEENDLVDLWNVSLEDITDITFASYEAYNLKSMTISLSDGASIEVISESEVGSTTVRLGDGSKWQHNYSDGSWQPKE